MCQSVGLGVHSFKHEYFRNQRADHNSILSEELLGLGKGCIRFGLDRIRILVSMATDCPHSVIIGKML